jgi:hypothetical protein
VPRIAAETINVRGAPCNKSLLANSRSVVEFAIYNELGAGCAVVIDAVASTIGKQEVCTYTEDDKIVTVTYLNDRVISASKSGF